MFDDLLAALFGMGGNAQPNPAQFQQAAPPIPTPNPETSVPGAGQPLAQPVQSPNIAQRIGGHMQNVNWQNAFEDAAAGLAGLDPTRPALQAAAQGYSGARGSARNRDTAASQAELAEGERQRTLEKHQADMKSSKFSDLNTASQIEEREGRRLARKTLDFDDRIQLEKVVNDYGQKLGLNSTFLPASERAEKLQQMEEYRKEVTRRVMEGETPVEAAENADQTTEPSATLTGPSPYDSPAQVASQQDFDALLPGSYFINPADGSVLQKPSQ